jgi:hypothetical protein
VRLLWEQEVVGSNPVTPIWSLIMKQYTVEMSYNVNIPVKFTIESDKDLTEEMILNMIRKTPSKFLPEFDSSMINFEESEFFDSLDDKTRWKNILNERLSLDDIVEDFI